MDLNTDASPRQQHLDRKRFEELFRSFYGAVKGFFLRKGLSEDDALELTQTTFLKVSGSEGPKHPGKEQAWLFVIASNVWRSHLRDRGAGKRQGSEVALQGLDDEGEGMLASSAPDGQPQPLESLLDKERRQELRRAIELLPGQRRACLEMYMFQELKYAEIAKILCIGVGTVKSQIFEARKTLKRELGSAFGIDSAFNEGGT